MEIIKILNSSPLEVFCTPLKLYPFNFQGKWSILRCDPPEQEKLQVMKMLSVEFPTWQDSPFSKNIVAQTHLSACCSTW